MNQPASMKESLRHARDLIRKRRYADAAEFLQKLQEADPKDEDVLELLGMARFFDDDLDAARKTFEELTQLNPGHTKAWVNLGAILNRTGEFKKAVEVLRRALQKDRKCAEGYYNMGIAQRGQNLNTMAISAYKEAIKLKPDMVEAHLNLGNIYVQMKNMGLALQCFQTALRYDPESKKAKLCLENAHSTQKSARKTASPFGRLVDGTETNQQPGSSGPRVLEPAERTAERELVQDVTKKVRSSAKALVPALEESLPGQMHRLQRIVLQSENRLSSAEQVESFTQLLDDIGQLKASIAAGLQEVREHLKSSVR